MTTSNGLSNHLRTIMKKIIKKKKTYDDMCSAKSSYNNLGTLLFVYLSLFLKFSREPNRKWKTQN